MLSNERYLGKFAWNVSKWVRVPGRKSRRRVMRPEAEWVRHEYSELAIVPRKLWDAARARLRRAHVNHAGRPAGTGVHVHLVSGLLRCGTCGGSMTVVGRKKKNGVSYARFGCTAHYSRGAAICGNGLSVSEIRASRTLVQALRTRLDGDEFVEDFAATFENRVDVRRTSTDVEPDAVSPRIRDCERRVANLTEALAKVGWSDSLASKLREEEEQLRRVRAEQTLAAKKAAGTRSRPNRATIARMRKRLFRCLETDPVRGRELLSRYASPVVMTPIAEGPSRGYRVTGAFNLAYFLDASEAGSGKSSCAGAIWTLEHPVFVDFEAVLVA